MRMTTAVGDTVEAGDEPEGEADDGAEDGHAEAHFERDAGAIERAAIEVAAIGIRAEPVCSMTASASGLTGDTATGSTVPR